MTMKEVNKDLLAVAKTNGMCKMGKRTIRHADNVEDMVEKYKQFLVWQMKHDNPGQAVLMKHFNGYKNEWCAVNVTGAVFHDQHAVCLLCGTSALATYSERSRGRIFARHGASVAIQADRGAHCVVSLYDNATAKVEAAEGAKVYVFLYDAASLEDTPESNEVIISKR